MASNTAVVAQGASAVAARVTVPAGSYAIDFSGAALANAQDSAQYPVICYLSMLTSSASTFLGTTAYQVPGGTPVYSLGGFAITSAVTTTDDSAEITAYCYWQKKASTPVPQELWIEHANLVVTAVTELHQ